MVRRSLLVLSLVCVPVLASAQPIGTYRWQTQGFCNVISVVITQSAGIYTLAGTDDQCGAATKAAVTGVAFQNLDGSIGLGLTVLATPGAAPLHIDATITAAASYSGTWRDDQGRNGPFALTAGAGTGGPERPRPPREASLLHTVTAGSISGFCSRIDHPLATNQPNAHIFVTHVWEGAYLNADTSLDFFNNNWYVCRSTGAPPLGHKYNVLVRLQ